MLRKLSKLLFNDVVFFLTQIGICFLGYSSSTITPFRLCAGLILLYCCAKGGEEKYVINPYSLLILTPISLLIYVNISDVFLVDLTPNTWLLIILNICALLLGIRVTHPTKFSERIMSPKESRSVYTSTAWIFTIIGIIPAYYYRFTGNFFPFSYILGMLSTAGVLSAFATKNRTLIICILAIYISPIVLGGASKTGVLTLLLATIIAYEKYIVSKNYKKYRKRLIIGCALAIPIMITAFTFANKERGSYDADQGFAYYSDRVEWNYSTGIFMPYMYIVTPWANLQYVTETQDTRSNGYWLTKPVLGIYKDNTKLPREYVPQSYSSFNTFSFIGLHFKDFGYWGSLLMSLFLGFFIKKVYSLYALSSCAFDAAQYVFTAQATLELFFSNHFFGQSYPFMIVIVMYLVKKLLKI